MPIDLPPVAGPMISEFGRQVSALGGALGQAYNAQQQALLDVESTSQVTRAKALALSTVDQFNQIIDTNPDYQNYGEMWKTQKQGLQDELSNILKLPSAAASFNEWWVGEQDKQQNYVYGETRKKSVASSQATLTVALEQYAQAGNEQAIYDTIKENVNGGVYTASEASSLAAKWIPEAHFASVFNYLDKNLSDADALSALTQDYTTKDGTKQSAAEYWGVTPDQLTQLITKFTEKNSASALAIKGKQEDLWKQVVTDAGDPSTMPSLDDLNKKILPSLVGSSYYDNAKSLRDSIQSTLEQNAKALSERGETRTYSGLKTQLLNWSGNGQAPWNPDTIDGLVTSEDPLIRLTKEDGDKLTNLYNQTMDDIASGKRKGPLRDDPAKVNELYAIALDVKNGWDSTTKKDMINKKGYLGVGVSGKTLDTILGVADSSETTTAGKRYYQAIQDWYGAVRTGLSQTKGNDAAIQKNAYEESIALQTLRKVMLDNPGNEEAWGRAVDNMMQDEVTGRVVKMVESKLGARFPGFFRGATPNEVKLNTALEQFPELKNDPRFMAEYKVALPVIEEKEREVLTKAGIANIKQSWQAPNGDLLYQAGNDVFRVVGKKAADGAIHNVVEKRIGDKWVQQ